MSLNESEGSSTGIRYSTDFLNKILSLDAQPCRWHSLYGAKLARRPLAGFPSGIVNEGQFAVLGCADGENRAKALEFVSVQRDSHSHKQDMHQRPRRKY